MTAVTADVADEAQVDEHMRRGIGAFGKIDFHHLNAEIFGTFAPLPDLPADEFDRVPVLTASNASLTGSGSWK